MQTFKLDKRAQRALAFIKANPDVQAICIPANVRGTLRRLESLGLIKHNIDTNGWAALTPFDFIR